MTKIAVFGDSYAAKSYSETPNEGDYFMKELFKLSNRKYNNKDANKLREGATKKYTYWMDVLNADTYAHSGSDLYYSYNQFINNHEKYDKCVFVVTTAERISTNIYGWIHCNNIEAAKEKYEFATDKKIKKYFGVLIDVFNEIVYKDLNRNDLIHQAMLDSIKLIRPDTIFIHAFNDLYDVYKQELDSWGLKSKDTQDYKKYLDLRVCHMTNANNQVLGNYILNNLNTSGRLDLSKAKWKIPNTADKNYHIIKTPDLFSWLIE